MGGSVGVPCAQYPLCGRRRLTKSPASETPEEINFLAANNTVPLATPFKPAMKLLARKPTPQMVMRKDEDETRKYQPTVEEIRQRQQRELEEKQRRYDEARAKIFGDSNPSSGQSSPGTITPPQQQNGEGSRQSNRGRGRGRGGAYRNDNRNENRNRQDNQARRPPTAGQHQASRELYDPSYSAKPGSQVQKLAKEGSNLLRGDSPAPRDEDQPIRAPRGPDSSGRGGFGLARRGTHDG
jgi:hypothetical protein